MKYRIKTITYNTGIKEYFAQYKSWFGWIGLDSEGNANFAIEGWCIDKTEALSRIELHFKGNTKKQKIEFEIIKK